MSRNITSARTTKRNRHYSLTLSPDSRTIEAWTQFQEEGTKYNHVRMVESLLSDDRAVWFIYRRDILDKWVPLGNKAGLPLADAKAVLFALHRVLAM